MAEDIHELLRSHYVLFSCEGTCEAVIMERLITAGKLVVPTENIVPDPEYGTKVTRKRRASAIKDTFLGVDYRMGSNPELLLARIVDVNPGEFKVPALYKNRIMVRDFITQPEIEILAIIKEGAYQKWSNTRVKGKQLSPSSFCARELGMSKIKTEPFLRRYWEDADELVRCIREYHSKLGKQKGKQLDLASLLS